jgi:hypothetical protein
LTARYAGKPEADVEDLLGESTYTDLVNRCYSLIDGQRVPAFVDGKSPPSRVVKRFEEHFRGVSHCYSRPSPFRMTPQ